MPSTMRVVEAPALSRLLTDLGSGSSTGPVSLGRYDVVGRLGQGGMGTVYHAIDRERDAPVALKTLSVADPTAVARLKREFRVVADLAHPHLAPVYELACADGLWFFTMECVEGKSLTSWARGGRDRDATTMLPVTRTLTSASQEPTAIQLFDDYALPASQRNEVSLPRRDLTAIRDVVAQLAQAIGALHDAGICHGDVKPDNVIVRDDGTAVLVDFGLARPLAERTGTNAGTPAYMPPEQLAGHEIGPESDWYGVGATLYRVLTGWVPFAAQSLVELAFKKSHHLPVAPSELLPMIPSELSDLCLALLRPEPSQRPGREAVLAVCGGAASQASSDRPRHSIFVGRERELCLLEQSYGTARAGRSTLVHLAGSSGIGKSALLDTFLGAVEGADAAIVLRGRCYERESVPYKGFDRIVDALAERLAEMTEPQLGPLLPEATGELLRVFPALASVPSIWTRSEPEAVAPDARELRRRAWEGLTKVFAALARDRTVVVVIDDLQWADPDSASLLFTLLESSEARALLVIAAFRPEEAADNPAVARYFEQAAALDHVAQVTLRLGPLDPTEAARLARTTLRQLGLEQTERRAARIVEEGQGVPFFIEELAHYVTSGERALDGEISLDEAILARVATLPVEQRQLMELVAVANNPLPQAPLFAAAELEAGHLMPLLALRQASLVRWLGAGANDAVMPYHDRIREAVIGALGEGRLLDRHLALGRALVKHHDERRGGWIFDAVRHLGAAEAIIDSPAERLEVAQLHLQAGDLARQSAAFPLAFRCFEAGIAFLPESAWNDHYDLTLRLHTGAAEAAYLSAEWGALEARIEDVKAHGRSVMDQLVAWEAQIDAHIGRHEYAEAISAASEVLALLGVSLPREPEPADVIAAVEDTLARLTEIGTEGLLARPDLEDPGAAAATRIQVRLSPAAYFGKPLLLPIIACNLVRTSIDRGLSTATPYALALFGLVLNTIEQYPIAHTWGQLAIELVGRWPDRRLEAATRHVLFNLVCCWMAPLSSVLDRLREVFDIGCRTGDFEYASYAAHGYVHNALYAGRPLAPLVEEALELGARMRALGQVNALHVHTPFEQLLKALTGRLEEPWRLDDAGYDEAELLAVAEAEGSRSGIFVQRVVMGMARYQFGRFAEAYECLDMASGYTDAAPSVWHVPMMHQFLALAACALLDDESDPDRRLALRRRADESLDALKRLAGFCRENFGHRVTLVEAALARAEGRHDDALAGYEEAIGEAEAGGWVGEVGLAHELAARCHEDPKLAARHLRAARDVYAAWGATGKVAHVEASLVRDAELPS